MRSEHPTPGGGSGEARRSGSIFRRSAIAFAIVHFVLALALAITVAIAGTHHTVTPEGEESSVRMPATIAVALLFPVAAGATFVLIFLGRGPGRFAWVGFAAFLALAFMFGLSIGPTFLAVAGLPGAAAIACTSVPQRMASR